MSDCNYVQVLSKHYITNLNVTSTNTNKCTVCQCLISKGTICYGETIWNINTTDSDSLTSTRRYYHEGCILRYIDLNKVSSHMKQQLDLKRTKLIQEYNNQNKTATAEADGSNTEESTAMVVTNTTVTDAGVSTGGTKHKTSATVVDERLLLEQFGKIIDDRLAKHNNANKRFKASTNTSSSISNNNNAMDCTNA